MSIRLLYEPRHKKNCFLHICEKRHRSAALPYRLNMPFPSLGEKSKFLPLIGCLGWPGVLLTSPFGLGVSNYHRHLGAILCFFSTNNHGIIVIYVGALADLYVNITEYSSPRKYSFRSDFRKGPFK